MEAWEIHWDDYYTLLQVVPDADSGVITAARLALTKIYHEKGTKPDPIKLARINAAYDVLVGIHSNRAAYDRAYAKRKSGSDSSNRSQATADSTPDPAPFRIEVEKVAGADVAKPNQPLGYCFLVRHVRGELPPKWVLGVHRSGAFEDAEVIFDPSGGFPIMVTLTLPGLPVGEHIGNVNFKVLHLDRNGFPIPDGGR